MTDKEEAKLMRSEVVMNHRALSGLLGHMASGPRDIGREVINLLRSDHPLMPEVRDALAQAIERGLSGSRIEEANEFGQLMPWFEIGGMGRDGRVGEAIRVRRMWFDAAEELERQRAAGAKGYDLMESVGETFGLGVDGIKKANAFRNRFLEELAEPESGLVSETLNYWGHNHFDHDPSRAGPTRGNHYHYARALFIDREAENSCR